MKANKKSKLRLVNYLFREPTNNTLVQLFRYGFVGGVAFLVDYGMLFSLTAFVGVPYLVSAAIAFIAGLTVNYLLSVRWVFSQNRSLNPKKEFLVFAIIGVIGLLFNELIMYISTEKIHFHYMLSKIISTVIVFIWNFVARKFLLFNKH